jgi:hypothetical protein
MGLLHLRLSWRVLVAHVFLLLLDSQQGRLGHTSLPPVVQSCLAIRVEFLRLSHEEAALPFVGGLAELVVVICLIDDGLVVELFVCSDFGGRFADRVLEVRVVILAWRLLLLLDSREVV